MSTFYKFLFHSFRFYRNSLGFVSLQELYPVVPRNSVRCPNVPIFFQALKIDFSQSYEHFDFPIMEENIYRVGQPSVSHQ